MISEEKVKRDFALSKRVLSWVILIATLIILLTLALRFRYVTENDSCTSGANIRSAVKNNIIYREEIKSYTLVCIDKANSNRDVVYNDSKEVVETCQEMAYSLYGGINSNGPLIARIISDINTCGDLHK